MAPKEPGPITPKRPLVLPKKATLTPPKAVAVPPSIKAKSLGNKLPLILCKSASPVEPPATKVVVKPIPPLNVVEALERKLSISSQGSLKFSDAGSRGVAELDDAYLSRRSLSRNASVQGDLDSASRANIARETDPDHFMQSPPSERLIKERLRLTRLGSQSSDYSAKHEKPYNLANGKTVQMRQCSSRSDDKTSLRDVARKLSILSRSPSDSDHQNAVGETPWLQIERRINEIRSLASANMRQISARYQDSVAQAPPSLYGNYNTHYEAKSDFKKERTNPMTYGMIQNLRNKKPANSSTKQNWDVVDGFLRPSRKPFASMSELSRHFRWIKPNDQTELIKLLLACRELEKVIEEQHAVMDMLDHDLKEARELLKLPEHLREISSKSSLESGPQEKPFYPTSDIPLFIKGRVSLLPGATDLQLSVAENREAKVPTKSVI